MEPACGQHGRPKLDPFEEIFWLLPIHSAQMTRETSQLLSHMRQKVVMMESRMERLQLPPGFPEHFDSPLPRRLPQVIGRQNSFRQEGIVRHCLQPRIALRHFPTQQCLRRPFVPQPSARSLVKDFQMPGIAVVDALEIPRARDAFREVPTLTPTFGHPLPSDGRGHTRTAAPPAGGAIPHGSSHHRESAVPRSAEGVFPNLVFVSIRKTYPMQACKIMHGLWGMGQMMFT